MGVAKNTAAAVALTTQCVSVGANYSFVVAMILFMMELQHASY